MGFIIFILLAALYFLPTIVAWNRRKPNATIIINLFLGWTLIGWVVALAMAYNLDEKEKAPNEERHQFKRWN